MSNYQKFIQFCISYELFEKIEKERGLVSRSVFIRDILERELAKKTFEAATVTGTNPVSVTEANTIPVIVQ